MRLPAYTQRSMLFLGPHSFTSTSELTANHIFSTEHSTSSLALESLEEGGGAKRKKTAYSYMDYQAFLKNSLQTSARSLSISEKPSFHLYLISEYVSLGAISFTEAPRNQDFVFGLGVRGFC